MAASEQQMRCALIQLANLVSREGNHDDEEAWGIVNEQFREAEVALAAFRAFVRAYDECHLIQFTVEKLNDYYGSNAIRLAERTARAAVEPFMGEGGE